MKYKFFLLFLVLMLCVAASSFAIELTFAQTCKEKTSAETQLYEMRDAGALQPAQTLPAGTYIKTNGLNEEGKTGITYGFEQHGYIDGSVIVDVTETVTLPSGRDVIVGEALVRSRSALNQWLLNEFGENLESSELIIPLDQNEKTIEALAFQERTDLETVIIREGTTSIGSKAFAQSSIRVVYLPDSLTQIANDAFEGCINLNVYASETSYAYAWAVYNDYVSANGYTPLQFGSTGDRVLNLVSELKNQGFYSGTETSNYNSSVENAVRTFQKAIGLTEDGIAGSKVQFILFNAIQYFIASEDVVDLSFDIYPVETIDWFEGGINELWPVNSNFKIYDVKTGLVWWAHRQAGSYHVEGEPLTAADTAVLCKIYGVQSAGEITEKTHWQRRPCLVTISEQTFACSLYGVPHNYPEGDTIADNNFDGQLCIHFTNSKPHTGKSIDSNHQKAIQEAYDWYYDTYEKPPKPDNDCGDGNHVSDGSYYSDTLSHWQLCTNCGKRFDVYNHSGFCDTPNTCYVCRASNVITDYTAHYPGDLFYYNMSEHWRFCKKCGVKCDISYHFANCTAPTTCSWCGAMNVSMNNVNHNFSSEDMHWNNEKHWYECYDCGEIIGQNKHYGDCDNPLVCRDCHAENVYIGYITHQYSLSEYAYDENSHWHMCSKCGEKVDEYKHFSNCSNPKMCLTCGAVNVNIKYVNHSCSSSYEHNNEYHWRTCTNTGEIIDKSQHNGDCSNPTACKVCKASDVKISWLNHTFDYSHYEHDALNHWAVCIYCGRKDITKHSSICSDNTDECDVCGASDGAIVKIEHDIDWDHYDSDSRYHWHACKRCGEGTNSKSRHRITHDNPNTCIECGSQNPVDPYIEHQYDTSYDGNLYEHWKICTVCGEIGNITDHEANCLYQKTCKICGMTDIHAHYSDHEFDYSIDCISKKDGHYRCCLVCGKEVYVGSHESFCNDPQKCGTCGATNVEIKRINHSWTYEYCHDDNEHWAVCKDCGEEIWGYRGVHSAQCDNPDICYTCGASGLLISSVSHNAYNNISYDDSCHWSVCLDCEKALWKHKHEAICSDPMKCNDCGYVSSTPLPIQHEYIMKMEITSEGHIYKCRNCDETDFSYHFVDCTNKKCLDCGMVVDDGFLDHWGSRLTGDIDQNGHWKYCEGCGLEYIEPHKAHCDAPKTCYICGETNNDYLFVVEHGPYEQIGAEYNCKRCNQTHQHEFPCYENGFCSICGISILQVEGSSITHPGRDYSTYVTTEARHGGVCRACGEVIDPEEHTYIHGYCSVCGRNNGIIEDLFTWTESQGKAIVTGFYGKTDTLIIPAMLNSFPVTAIGSQAFMDNTSLRSVLIPETVTTIGTYAFRGCTSLQSISLPEQLATISNYAFYGTSALKEIYMPLSVSSIANAAFLNSSLERVTCYSASYAHQWASGKGYRLTLIPLYTDAESLILPGGLQTIEEDAFSGIIAKRIVVPDGCTAIGKKAFSFCADLEVLELPASVGTIDDTMILGSEGVMILAPKGSYAVEWAEKNHIQVIGK